MPRTLPAALTTAMDSGVFKAYLAIGQRNYTAGIVSSYTTLITNILYYKYDGLELEIKWASPNLPEDDGLTLGNKYYIERGVTIAGVNYTIKSASLRFDDYTYKKQIVTASFSLFSNRAKPATIAGDTSYTNVLTAMSPNYDIGGTAAFRTTPENAGHWDYNFYATGRQVIVKSYQAFLPLIRQKYLIKAVDNSDDTNEDEVLYYHLTAKTLTWHTGGTVAGSNTKGICYSEELGLFVVASKDTIAPYNNIFTSNDGITWTAQSTGVSGELFDVDYSPELNLFVAVGLGAKIMTSPDGVTWTARTAGNTYSLAVVRWIPTLSLFIAGGNDSGSAGTKAIQTSPDGITWTERTTPSTKVTGLDYSPTLGMLAANGDTKIITSPDGTTWTQRYNAVSQISMCWSEIEQCFIAGGSNAGFSFILKSTNGTNWTQIVVGDIGGINSIAYNPQVNTFVAVGANGAALISNDSGESWSTLATDAHTYYKVIWVNALSKIFTLWGVNNDSGGTLYADVQITNDHTITQGDIEIETASQPLLFLWRDETQAINTNGPSTGLTHNLGYLESTDAPPSNFNATDRGAVTIGIHLKYKSGDIFTLAINSTQSVSYHAYVTEILDPNAEIGWRCEIKLIERFANTNGGALPGTIERISSYTPLGTTNFNGNLDSSVNNLQALADKVDDLTLGEVTQAELDAVAATIPTTEGIEDIVGAMVSGNTETGIAVTYDDTNAKLNFDAQTAGDARYAPIAKGVTNGDAHTHSQHLDRTRNIPFPALTDTAAVIGSADTHGSLSQDLHFHLADGVTTTIKNLAGIPVPQDVVSGGTCNFVILWSSSAAGNNVNLTVICREVGSNDTAHTNLVASTANYAANANADKVQRTAISMTAPTPGKSISFAVLRNGANAGDTNTGTMSLWGVFCEYTADM